MKQSTASLSGKLDRASYDAPHGQKLLTETKGEEPNAAPLSVVLNWTAELEK